MTQTRTEQFKTKKGDIVFILLILMTIVAMVNVLVLQSQYSSGANDQAVATSEAYALDVSEKFAGRLDSVRERTQAIADIAGVATGSSELHDLFTAVLSADENQNAVFALRYFIGDNEFTEHGGAVEQESPTVVEMNKNRRIATYGIIYCDGDGAKPSVVCYCPVENDHGLIDGIVIYYSEQVVLSVGNKLDSDKLGFSELSAICWYDNNELQIRSVLHDRIGNVQNNERFLKYVEELAAGDTKPSSVIREALVNADKVADDKEMLVVSGNKTVSVEISNERYVVVIGRASEYDAGLYTVNMYRESTVYAEGLALMETSIITMAILLIVIALFTIYYLISRHRIYARIEALDTINPVLQCPTLLKFERDAKAILDSHRITRFAVVISHLQHFGYLSEKYGDSASTAVLRHLRDVFKNAMTRGETYGHVDNGEFVFLLHYNAEENLEKRLLSLYSVAKKHYLGDEIPEDYDIKLLFGIYKVDRSVNIAVPKMVEKALEVCDLPSRTDINKVCNFYDDSGRSDYMMKAEIENKMEAALEMGEFRLFYQPKYNLKNDRIDGAEILVRWYNSETKNYRSPAEFLPVFEENGFISKLDRHIYYAACENTAKWIEEGRKIYPISVNISRVTAIQPDFFEYYSMVKKHFNIPNGFITLEFTESFAYENYEYLSTVAQKLRGAGFLCSIDDFGTGYSSFNILKLLEMDEIKLDRFFLRKGVSGEKDDMISEGMISIGNKMGLKTTQEGVETLADLQKLRAMGCKVIQGYFFAKPMSSNDYKQFIDDFARENPVLAAEKAAKAKE